jgi:hypothetical protein
MVSNIYSPAFLFRKSQADGSHELGLDLGMASSDGSFALSAQAALDLLLAKQEGQAPVIIT